MFPSLGSPLHLWVSARSLYGTSHTKSLLSIKCHPKLSPAHEHFPSTYHLWISSEFMGCLQPTPPSLCKTWCHGYFLCSLLHTPCSAQKKLHAQINQG